MTTSPSFNPDEGQAPMMTDNNDAKDAVVTERSFDAPVDSMSIMRR